MAKTDSSLVESAQPQSGRRLKTALIVADNFSAWNFRRSLLKRCISAGLDAHLCAPSGPWDAAIAALGVKHLAIRVKRHKTNPLQDLLLLHELTALFKREKFDLVHTVSIKPNIYGALAAHRAGCQKIIASVTGLGNLYRDDPSVKMRLLRTPTTLLYRRALSATHRVWFQNPDDEAFFVSEGIVDRAKAVLIPGSGVDANYFRSANVSVAAREGVLRALGIDRSPVIVTMSARTLWSKGVREFVEAARILRDERFQPVFLLIGDGEPGNPLNVPEEYLRAALDDNVVWLGWRNDIRDLLAVSSIVVLPSRSGEGLPRSLLEGMAMEKPIVTTDVPGCRQVVDNARNGYLVPPRNSQALADAIRRLASDADLRLAFGQCSRRRVEMEFDQDIINRQILRDLYNVEERQEVPI